VREKRRLKRSRRQYEHLAAGGLAEGWRNLWTLVSFLKLMSDERQGT
jgi:hypothetical protein